MLSYSAANMNFWRNIAKPIIGLAPMDGVTDASFRYITAKHGAPDVTLTEFVNIQSAFHSPHTLIKDFIYSEIERPVVAQIYGKTPELFYKVAHIVCELGFDGLDINMGCPAKKVAAGGCGAAARRRRPASTAAASRATCSRPASVSSCRGAPTSRHRQPASSRSGAKTFVPATSFSSTR